MLSYTQPPPMTREEIDVFLRKQEIARICTLNDDGTIHATAVWYFFKDGLIIVGSPAATRKVTNIKRNRNVTVFIDDPTTAQGVLIYGKAELDYNPDIRDGITLYEKYMPTEKAEKLTRGLLKASKGGAVKITIRPERLVSFDTTKDSALKAAAQG